jgi:hypothetical protein
MLKLMITSNYPIWIEEVLPFLHLQSEPDLLTTRENFIYWWDKGDGSRIENLLISPKETMVGESLQEPISPPLRKLLLEYYSTIETLPFLHIEIENHFKPDSLMAKANFIVWWYKGGRSRIENLLISPEETMVGESLREPISPPLRKLLMQYYRASKILIEAITEIPNITPKVREEIEETLFLPSGKYNNG